MCLGEQNVPTPPGTYDYSNLVDNLQGLLDKHVRGVHALRDLCNILDDAAIAQHNLDLERRISALAGHFQSLAQSAAAAVPQQPKAQQVGYSGRLKQALERAAAQPDLPPPVPSRADDPYRIYS